MSTPSDPAQDPLVAPTGEDDPTTRREGLELELMEEGRSEDGEAIGDRIE